MAQLPIPPHPGSLPLPGGHPSRQGLESAGRARRVRGGPGLSAGSCSWASPGWTVAPWQAVSRPTPPRVLSLPAALPPWLLPLSCPGLGPGSGLDPALAHLAAAVAAPVEREVLVWLSGGGRALVTAGRACHSLSSLAGVGSHHFPSTSWSGLPPFFLHVLAAWRPEAPPLGSMRAGREQASLVHKGLSSSRSPVRMSHLIWARRPPFLEGTVLTPWVSPSDQMGSGDSGAAAVGASPMGGIQQLWPGKEELAQSTARLRGRALPGPPDGVPQTASALGALLPVGGVPALTSSSALRGLHPGFCGPQGASLFPLG